MTSSCWPAPGRKRRTLPVTNSPGWRAVCCNRPPATCCPSSSRRVRQMACLRRRPGRKKRAGPACRPCLQEHNGELAPMLQLLAAALDERGLLLEGQARNTRSRIAVVQGLMAMLPASARPLLGFASNVNEVSEGAPAILFSDADLDSSRWRAGDEMALPSLPGGHFVALLAQWWVGDLPRLLEAIDALGAVASRAVSWPRDSTSWRGSTSSASVLKAARRFRRPNSRPSWAPVSPSPRPCCRWCWSACCGMRWTSATARPPCWWRNRWTPTPRWMPNWAQPWPQACSSAPMRSTCLRARASPPPAT